MKKKLFAAVSCLVCILLLTACEMIPQAATPTPDPTPVPTPVITPTPTPAPPTYSIVILAANAGEPAYAQARQAIQAAADELSSQLSIIVRLDERNAADDPAAQMQQAQTLIAAKPAAVIMTLCDANAASDYAALSKSSGVPLLFMEKEPIVALYETFMQEDNAIFVGGLPQDAGEQQGRLLKTLLDLRPSIDRNGDGALQYIMLMGVSHDADAIALTHYSVEAAIFAGVNLQKLGSTYTCNWNAAVAENCMNAALVNEEYGGNIEVVFANSDAMALGAAKALQHAGYNLGEDSPHIAVIGAGGTEEAIAAIQAHAMDGTVLLDHTAVGDTALRLALNAAMGEDWLNGTEYELYADGYSVRIPYMAIK
ncbi:MAG: substrate-binding domain-containing protein [Eubacteriales bacterium]|nr:substrate-binding domain-containing protein [Eubacteriales bacterium]